MPNRFPSLGLEQIFGALAFYMANREIVDHYLSEGERALLARQREIWLVKQIGIGQFNNFGDTLACLRSRVWPPLTQTSIKFLSQWLNRA